jgi:hypothetical protein
MQSSIKYNKQYIDRIWRKIIGDGIIKNYNYKEYPEKLDYYNDKDPQARIVTENNMSQNFFYVTVGLRKGATLSAI